MERDNKEIITPIGQQKIRIKAWLTARERRSIRAVLLEGVEFSTKEGDTENLMSNYKMNASSMDKMQDKTLETVIVDINGSPENVLEAVLDMREEDYNFIIKEIDKVTGEQTEKESKKK